jgi:polyisoprenoid-binding protein YceI
MKRLFCLCVILLACSAGIRPALCSPSSRIDPDQSVITIRVLRSGLFSFLAHNHDIEARGLDGEIRTSGNPGVEFSIDAKRITVLDHPQLSADQRAEVQETMEGPKVLDVERYPLITFRSTSVDETAPGRWQVSGILTLHGQSNEISLEVQGSGSHYTGETSLRQTRFGITPVRLFGGTVTIKDEVRLEFDIRTTE